MDSNAKNIHSLIEKLKEDDKSLRSVEISGENVDVELLKSVLAALAAASLPSDSLTLQRGFPGQLMQPVCEVLEACGSGNLKRLKLENLPQLVTTQSLPSLLKAVGNATALQTLSFANNPLGPRGGKVLAASSLLTQNLQSLNLSNCRLGHLGAQALGGVLPSTLCELYLSRNKLGHDGVWKLVSPRPFAVLQYLRVLDLSDNDMLDDGCMEVARQLEENGEATSLAKNLRELRLGGNSITKTGLAFLAKQLQVTGPALSLQVLDLARNHISGDGVLPLASSLQDVTSLEVLDLSENNIQDMGCTLLAEGLAGKLTDTENDEEEEEDDEDSSDEEEEEVYSKSCLRVLKLTKTNISDGGAGSFVELLDDIPKLVEIDLTGNPDISEARTRILGMLLKHRDQTSTLTSPRQTVTPRQSSDSRLSAVGLPSPPMIAPLSPNLADETSRDYGSPVLNDDAVDEGRDLVMGLSFDSLGGLSESSAKVPMDYVRFLTNNFEGRIISKGVFGPLFAGKDSKLNTSSRESDEHHSIMVIRKLDMNPAGPLRAVREKILQELVELKHPNLLPLLAFVPGPREYCFIFDVSNGRSLQDALEKDRKIMTWAHRVRILTWVAEALNFIHSGDEKGRKPSFHGDIKPSNIYVCLSEGGDRVESVQLADGGLSRLLATDRSRFASGDCVFGSRGYRCPRYERGSCQYDSSSDMFSFGIVVGEVMSGCLQASQKNPKSGLLNDFYYDHVLFSSSKHPQQQGTLRVDTLAGPVSKGVLQGLGQIVFSCLSPAVMQRPSAHTVGRILTQISV